MKSYLFDTNLLLLLLRKDKRWFKIKEQFDLENTINFISIVSLGELWSLGLRNQWGENRLSQIEDLAQDFTIVDISIDSLINCYGEIDAFSQNKLKHRPLPITARNMGKNDLWIAATASVLNLTLITSDQDFNHLTPDFLSLEALDMQQL